MFKEISGWGKYPLKLADVYNVSSLNEIKNKNLELPNFIPRGMGRSYGDSANSENILELINFKKIINFDPINGIAKVQAGITVGELLATILSEGWFLPVSPGSSYVTIGGAIASDVHGKNHIKFGTFSQNLISMEVLLSSGDIIEISKNKNTDLFYATCGGMGLTCVILSATIKLLKINSNLLTQKTFATLSIDETIDIFEEYKKSTYIVSWIDCFSTNNFGKGIVKFAEHTIGRNLQYNKKNIFCASKIYSRLLNSYSVSLFNKLYYFYAKKNKKRNEDLFNFFFTLDLIKNWNLLYGNQGFLQYQFVIPISDIKKNMKIIFDKIYKNNERPLLSVLKVFGSKNKNFLSFPIEGYSLALDFRLNNSSIDLIHNLNEIIVDMGGRVYLTKDAIMKEKIFKKSYSQWEEFQTVREIYKAKNKFISDQSIRLGLN